MYKLGCYDALIKLGLRRIYYPDTEIAGNPELPEDTRTRLVNRHLTQVAQQRLPPEEDYQRESGRAGGIGFGLGGALLGAGVGHRVGGLPGALAGAGLGMLGGGTAGYFGGRAYGALDYAGDVEAQKEMRAISEGDRKAIQDYAQQLRAAEMNRQAQEKFIQHYQLTTAPSTKIKHNINW